MTFDPYDEANWFSVTLEVKFVATSYDAAIARAQELGELVFQEEDVIQLEGGLHDPPVKLDSGSERTSS